MIGNLNRVAVIASSLLLFQNPVSALQAAGFATTLVGVGMKLCIQDTVDSTSAIEYKHQEVRGNDVPDAIREVRGNEVPDAIGEDDDVEMMQNANVKVSVVGSKTKNYRMSGGSSSTDESTTVS